MERKPDNIRPIRNELMGHGSDDRYVRLFAPDGDGARYARDDISVCGSLEADACLDDRPLVETDLDRSPLPGRAGAVFELVEHARTDFAAWERAFGPAPRIDDETALVIRRLLRGAATEAAPA